MSDENGVTNYDLLQEMHGVRLDQSNKLTQLEHILVEGFKQVASAVHELKMALVGGLLKTITILCYCLVAIIMWVTAVKQLPRIMGISFE